MARILPLSELSRSEALDAQIDAIFFESTARTGFSSDQERAAYHDLWLGRYLHHFPDMAFIALDETGAVSGYLAGSPVSNRPPLPGPDYYLRFSTAPIEACPAHLHVNVRSDRRGKGIGAALIGAFRNHCETNLIPGFHAVTAANSASAEFFIKCGLKSLDEADWENRHLMLMGDELTSSA